MLSINKILINDANIAIKNVFVTNVGNKYYYDVYVLPTRAHREILHVCIICNCITIKIHNPF